MFVDLITESIAQVLLSAYFTGQTVVRRRPVSAISSAKIRRRTGCGRSCARRVSSSAAPGTGQQFSRRSKGPTSGRQDDNQVKSEK